MVSVNKIRWFMSAISLFSMPLMADCGSENEIAKVAEAHVQQRIEGKIAVNTLLGSEVLQVDSMAACDNNSTTEELRFVATQPNSEAAPKFFRMIDGIPAYYLNKNYAYTIKMDDLHSFTAQGTRVAAQKRNGAITMPRATVSIYAATDNPEALRLSSSQIGVVKNEQHGTVAKLKLSANIETIETCVINTPQLDYNFGEIEIIQLPVHTGKTNIRESNTISVSCTNEERNKNVSIQLSGTTPYADADKSVIASDNPAIGFVLYHNDVQITQYNKTHLGIMKKQLNPMITAYIYKLREKVNPGAFSGNAEYVIKFD